jgi:hypothetical protein
MGLLRHLRIASVAISTLLVGCSTTGLMDSTDDMGGSSSGGGSKTGDLACSACFDTYCAWEVTECAADPECAEWLTCARGAPGNASGSIDREWLSNSCVDATGPTATTLQNALSACLTGTVCCEGGAPTNGTDASAMPGAADDGGMYGGGGGSGAGPVEYGDSGQDNSDGTWTCPTAQCGCLDCLYAFKHGELPDDTECTAAIQACAGNEACGRFLGGFAECMQADTTNAATGDQRALEACLFVEATGDWALEGGFEQFMETVYPCATGPCNSYCVVETARHCIQCQEQWCEAEYTAYLSDGNALLGTWCRSYCQTHPDDGQCPGKCAPYLQAGVETLQLYGQCVQASCPDDC